MCPLLVIELQVTKCRIDPLSRGTNEHGLVDR